MNRTNFINAMFKVIIISAAVLLSATLRLLLWKHYAVFLGYGPFYLVVLFAALWGGFYLGIYATALSDVMVFYSTNTGYTPGAEEYISIVTLLYFFFNGMVFSIVGEIKIRTRRKLKDALSTALRLSKALDCLPVYVYIKDQKHRYLYANKPTLELFECSKDDLQDLDDFMFFPKDTAIQLHRIDDYVFREGQMSHEEIITSDDKGERRVYWEVKTPLQDEHGNVEALCGISTDITRQKTEEESLRESEERFHSLFDSAAIGMAVVDLQGRFVNVNKALCDIIGYSEEDIIKKTFMDITYPDDLESDLNYVSQLMKGKIPSYQLEKRYFHKNGHIIWVLLTGSVVHDEQHNIKYFIAQVMDITQKKLLMKKLEHHANEDYLTGLHNRRFFFEQGELEIERSKRLDYQIGVLMLDLDYFKKINDLHGHKIGDRVLQHFSQLLTSILRSIDVIGRIGGEEFAVILPRMSGSEVLEIAERIRETIEKSPFEMDDSECIYFTVSIGVYLPSSKYLVMDHLLNEADKALYQAKKCGRNRVCMRTDNDTP